MTRVSFPRNTCNEFFTCDVLMYSTRLFHRYHETQCHYLDIVYVNATYRSSNALKISPAALARVRACIAPKIVEYPAGWSTRRCARGSWQRNSSRSLDVLNNETKRWPSRRTVPKFDEVVESTIRSTAISPLSLSITRIVVPSTEEAEGGKPSTFSC